MSLPQQIGRPTCRWHEQYEVRRLSNADVMRFAARKGEAAGVAAKSIVMAAASAIVRATRRRRSNPDPGLLAERQSLKPSASFK